VIRRKLGSPVHVLESVWASGVTAARVAAPPAVGVSADPDGPSDARRSASLDGGRLPG
jgi:hypothetical protein